MKCVVLLLQSKHFQMRYPQSILRSPSSKSSQRITRQQDKRFQAWAKDFAVVIENFRETFGQIEVEVEKSKIKTKETSGWSIKED